MHSLNTDCTLTGWNSRRSAPERNYMSKQSEPKYFQHFELHMKNGEKVDVYEDYEIPAEKGIIGQFKRGQKKYLEIGDLLCGYIIPYDQISFIAITDVRQGF